MHGNTEKFMKEDNNKVGILGAGSFGLAFSLFMNSYGFKVSVWGHNPQHIAGISVNRESDSYLPGFVFPESIEFSDDLENVVKKSRYLFIMIPSQHLRTLFKKLSPIVSKEQIIIIGSKGIEIDTLSPIYKIVEDEFEHTDNFIYLSGPTFAREIATGMPSAAVIASKNEDILNTVQKKFSNESLRLYTSDDVIGVNISGALKNVIAIAAGITDGLSLGLNSRAAIITRGLAEITRLGVKMNANPLTFQGLAGVGDLVLTCTGGLSRNRMVGIRLGKGETLKEISNSMKMVAEGIYTAKAAYHLSKKIGVEMPITEVVYKIIYEGTNVNESISILMGRKLKSELYGFGKG